MAAHINQKRVAGKTLALIALIAILVVMISPFFVIAVNCVQDAVGLRGERPAHAPRAVDARRAPSVLGARRFHGKLWNSLFISTTVAVLAVGLSLLNAFALGIGKIKGALAILIIFVVANTLPQEVLVYPLYYMAKAAGLYDKQLSVIIIFTVVQSAFGTYLLSSAYSAFPRELLEAAIVDGCSKPRLLFYIVTPMSKATLSVLFTFFFLWTWNEFFIPLVMLISNARQTVPIAISVTQGQFNMDATMASASALLGILPCIVFFVLFQRTLAKGITAGAIK